MQRQSFDALIEAVREAARQEIMPRFRNLDPSAIQAKSAADDLVTDADKGAERRIAESIRQLLPGAAIVGEEAVEEDPGLLALIGESDWTVIVDPVDGTWNFAKGLATFGVILAVTHRGETVFGLLYDPVLDDWIMAEKAAGAWYARPGLSPVPVRCSDGGAGSNTGYMPLSMFPRGLRDRLIAVSSGFERVNSLRCSCHEYRMLAQGHAGFCLAGALKPWDHAAGALIVTEAGGAARMMDGSPYAPTRRDGTLVTATSEEALEDVVARIGPAFAAS